MMISLCHAGQELEFASFAEILELESLLKNQSSLPVAARGINSSSLSRSC